MAKDDLKHIPEFLKERPKTKAGLVRCLWPEIRQALNTGYTLKEICLALNGNGFPIGYSRLRSLVACLLALAIEWIHPRNYRQFTHGYAVTAHRSQGKSVDSVIISADGMRKELFYVAASRGRKSVQVFTGDKQSLRESVARSAARQSASELARRAKPSFRRGIHRGLAAAREMAKRAAVYISLIMGREMPLQNLEKQPRMEREHDHGISR